MSDFNWCHGPKCHKEKTTDRVRGVKGSKVLRTRKVPQNKWNEGTKWRYFCSRGCMEQFVHFNLDEFIRLHPRTEALETPINIYKATIDTPYWGRRVETKIEVDETRQID